MDRNRQPHHYRTENTIKNHFNATKRRHNSRKKSNKDDQKPRSTLLQDYIKSNKLDHKWTAATLSCVATPTSSTISEDPPPTTTVILQELSESTIVHDSPPSHFTHTCDEELLFMQNLFPITYSSNPPFPGTSENISFKGVKNQKAWLWMLLIRSKKRIHLHHQQPIFTQMFIYPIC